MQYTVQYILKRLHIRIERGKEGRIYSAATVQFIHIQWYYYYSLLAVWSWVDPVTRGPRLVSASK